MDAKSFVDKYKDKLHPVLIGNEYACFCPAHEDHVRSLHITDGTDEDKNSIVLIHCKAKCTPTKILKALGASWSEINGKGDQERIRKRINSHYAKDPQIPGAKVSAIYDYRDACGSYLYSRVRFRLPDGSKAMRFAQIDYQTERIRSYSRGSDPVLYRLPELLSSIGNGYPVFIVEGEKDVHTLSDQLHYAATTAGSASDWKQEYGEYFRGASVVVLPDNDEAGRDMADKVKEILSKCAYRYKIVHTSDRNHGDVTDYLEEGHTAEDLKKLIDDQDWITADWVNVDKNGKHTINTDLLAACIERNEHYFIVRLPDDNRDSTFTYKNGVYSRVNRSQFIADVIRPYIPRGRATANAMENVAKLLLTSGSHVVKYDDLDRDEKHINLLNGLLNTETWEFGPHRPDLLSTIQLHVNYDPAAKDKPNFDRYINDLVRDSGGTIDKSKLNVIQEFVGLILSNISVYKLKKALFLISFIGNTGKSTLDRVINSMLGNEYSLAIDLKNLDGKEGNRFALGKLRGKRFLECGDQSSATIKDSSIFKKLTGGDKQNIEKKGVQGEDVVFRGGIIINSNSIPYFEDDHGKHMIERILLVPLEHTIVKKDIKLEDEMLKEKSAIFNWFMEGLKRLSDNGMKLSECDSIKEFMQEYREQGDSLYRYLSKNYEVTNNPRDLIQKTVFDQDYHVWCSMVNARSKEYDKISEIRKRNIKKRMISYGINIKKAHIGEQHGVICYVGIKERDGGYEF